MKIGAGLDVMEDTLKTPILVSLFRALGWLNVLATALMIFAVLSDRTALLSTPMVFVVAGSGGLLALVFFGVAQLLMSIAKIEFYVAREKNEPILRTLHKIEGHLEAMRGNEKKA